MKCVNPTAAPGIMETDMAFPVGDRTFDEVSGLVSQKGIKLEPLVRLTSEKYPASPDNLPEGLRVSNSVEINGLLIFKDETFTFSLGLVDGKKGKTGNLSVEVGDHNLIKANGLIEALNAIFPTKDPFPVRLASTSTKAVWNQLGCLFFILVISAGIFFFGYGVYRFFIPQRG